MKKKKKFEEINIELFTSVVLAAILLGFVTHELTHMLLMNEVTSITLRFGGAKVPFSVCCLGEMESALEEIAYTVQIIVMGLWIILNHNVYRREK